MGRTITVKFIEDAPVTDYHGLCLPDNNSILIGMATPRTKQEHIYLHELTHLIFHMLGEKDLYENERIIDSFSGLLHQALTTEKGFQ